MVDDRQTYYAIVSVLSSSPLLAPKSYYRRYKICKQLKEEIAAEFDRTIRDVEGEFTFIRATDAFKMFRKFLFFFDPKTDKERFDVTCKYIVSSMFASESKNR